MRENTLLKIALICSLAGLAALYFIFQKIEIKEYKPGFLNKDIGDDVKLSGKIIKITDRGTVVFMELSQQAPVSVVVFSPANSTNLKKDDFVEVFGKVQEYNGKSEIIAQKIRVIK